MGQGRRAHQPDSAATLLDDVALLREKQVPSLQHQASADCVAGSLAQLILLARFRSGALAHSLVRAEDCIHRRHSGPPGVARLRSLG